MKYYELTNLLKGEYAEVLKKAELYSFIQKIPTERHDDVLMDLTDFLLTAQKKNKPVKEVIGDDVESFCREFVGSKSIVERLFSVFEGFYYIAWITLVVSLFDIVFLLSDSISVSDSISRVDSIIIGTSFGFLIAVVMQAVFKPLFFKWKKLSLKLYMFVNIMLIVTVGALAGSFFEITVHTLILLVSAAAYILVFTVAAAVRNYKETGSLFKRKTPEEKSEKQEIEIQRYKSELINAYERKNKRLDKKGKPKMTHSSYMKEVEGQNRKTMIFLYVLYSTLLAVIVALTMYEGLTNTWNDAIILCAVLFAVEIPVAGFFTYIYVKAIIVRTKILKLCKEKGVDIFDL